MILKELHSIESKSDRLKFISEKGVRKELISEKKSMPKTSDSIVYYPTAYNTIKYVPSGIELGEGEVYIVGNSIGFMDSHEDVSMRGSWTKTVQERGNRVPILKDHSYKVDSAFAENLGVFVSEVPIIQLGYKMEGGTEVLGAKIKPDDEMYEKYAKGIVKEHSVGLQYIKLGMAINDEKDEEGYKEWISNIDKVINRELAEERGYFFPVYEQKLIEFSAVVFGSNPYTPAFTNTDKSLDSSEPSDDTQKVKEPIQSGIEFFKNLTF